MIFAAGRQVPLTGHDRGNEARTLSEYYCRRHILLFPALWAVSTWLPSWYGRQVLVADEAKKEPPGPLGARRQEVVLHLRPY